MQRSRLPLTLALVTFALTLLAGGYTYSNLFRTVPALLAVRDLPAGAELTPDLVRVVQVPAGGRVAQALYGPGQITGMYAAVPLFAEEVLTTRHITAQAPVRDPFVGVGPGVRVVSLPVKSEAVLGGAMRPGDMVDVVAAWPGPEGKPGAVEILATAVRVVDLRNAAGGSTGGGSAGATAGPVAGSGAGTGSTVGSGMALEGGPDATVPTAVLLLVSTQQARQLVGAVESKAAIYLWLTGRERS